MVALVTSDGAADLAKQLDDPLVAVCFIPGVFQRVQHYPLPFQQGLGGPHSETLSQLTGPDFRFDIDDQAGSQEPVASLG